KDRTTLWDEGCGELTVVDLIDSSARHFMTWLNTWEEDGFTPVLSQIDGRMEKEHALSFEGKSGTFLGMDENANLILKLDQGTDLVPVSEALDTHMEAFV
ncbi:MAG: biotin/lipoate--protein ligase family protein, partial [Pseudomonadota bacterium]